MTIFTHRILLRCAKAFAHAINVFLARLAEADYATIRRGLAYSENQGAVTFIYVDQTAVGHFACQ